MSIFRLLPLSLLIAVSAVPVAAQTSPEKAPVAPSIDAAPLTAHIGEYSPGLNQFSVPKVWLNGPDRKPPDDIFCLKMRSYKVARDQPDSDATHLVGYSTCQPAARFRTYTVKGVILPEQP